MDIYKLSMLNLLKDPKIENLPLFMDHFTEFYGLAEEILSLLTEEKGALLDTVQ